ncbi:hypothetical protein PHMEG_0001271 [Phytophthora megakarya]|uniref:Endonuclease/exonuclease/phosphatase domain-containing protein n=1 Tax=Phytophthora megakarya TaxID=4795 RepID=A0A225X1J8_9STRA|nr:hypothetical protein PHMEG_0001271 [Phytophthora megakarya]
MTILFRVGRRCNLEVIGTYCPDTPHRNAQCTQQEREWISWQRRKGQEHRNICVIAGDFNAYTDDRLDRQGINERDRWTQRASVAFCDWTEEQEVISTFNLRHPTTQRFTYQNGAIKTALDDVYISAQHAHQVKRSGIWLYSLNTGDHVGTPFVSLALDRVQLANNILQGQNLIRVLAVRRPTPAELLLFSSSIEDELQIRPLRLPPPLPDESDGIISSWLHTAITHLYDCMYQAAKSGGQY